jgi:hypothetical protein
MANPNAKERRMEREELDGQVSEQPSEEDEASALTDLDVAEDQGSAVRGGDVKDSHDRYA